MRGGGRGKAKMGVGDGRRERAGRGPEEPQGAAGSPREPQRAPESTREPQRAKKEKTKKGFKSRACAAKLSANRLHGQSQYILTCEANASQVLRLRTEYEKERFLTIRRKKSMCQEHCAHAEK